MLQIHRSEAEVTDRLLTRHKPAESLLFRKTIKRLYQK